MFLGLQRVKLCSIYKWYNFWISLYTVFELYTGWASCKVWISTWMKNLFMKHKIWKIDNLIDIFHNIKLDRYIQFYLTCAFENLNTLMYLEVQLKLKCLCSLFRHIVMNKLYHTMLYRNVNLHKICSILYMYMYLLM